MSELTPEILRQIMPTLSKEKRELYAPMLDVTMAEFQINNERRVAAYLANLAHESGNLTRWEENLNYSAKRLTQVWPSRFPNLAAAEPYAHNPKALANRTYGGRMGNNRQDDGWKYRGRFPLQCTGKDLYRKASEELDIPELLTDPDKCMEEPMIGFRVSAWIFAKEKGGNRLADAQKLKALTKAINGGYNGLEERIALYNRGLRILPDDFRLTANGVVPKLDEDTPDFLAGAEDEEDHHEEPHEEVEKPNGENKGATTSDKSPDKVEGTPPPAPAVEIKASQPSLLSRITSLSIPTGLGTAIVGIKAFVTGIPPWGWAVIAGVFVIGLIVAAWLHNESMKRADGRTLKVMDAAADQDKNNLRLV